MTEEDPIASLFERFAASWKRFVLDFKAVRTVVLLLTLLATMFAVSTYIVLALTDDKPGLGSRSAALAVSLATVGSLTASLLAVATSYFVQARYIRVVEEHQTLQQVDFDHYIRSAHHRIQVSVHGWDGLFCGEDGKDKDGELKADWTNSSRAKAWKRFFARDDGLNTGKLSLILPAIPISPQPLETDPVPREWVNLVAIAARTGKTLSAQVDEIRSTVYLANQLGGDSVEVSLTNELSWTCLLTFDDDLLISLYTAQRKKGDFRAPAFSMASGRYRYVTTWLRTELS